MGCSGDLRTLLEQILEDRRGLVGRRLSTRMAGPEKLGLRPDVRALEEGLDRAPGRLRAGPWHIGRGPGPKEPRAASAGLRPVGAGPDSTRRKNDRRPHKRQPPSGARPGPGAVPAEELAQAVRGAGASGQDRLMLQMPADVLGQAAGGLVPPGAVLLQGLHHDPIQVAPDLLVGGPGTPGQCQVSRMAVGTECRSGDRRSRVAVRIRVEGLTGSCSRITRCISM